MERESMWERSDGSLWKEVKIPTNNEFLEQYHQWIFKKVANEFKRDKNRIQDTVQNVRTRLLQKDFIGRWFFKHLTHEFVSRLEAERMLGGNIQLKFVSTIDPVVGKRSEPDSLWRISDILKYAKFDHERYYYSIQNHTIGSDTVLRLLGYLHLSDPDPDGKIKDISGNRVGFRPEAYNTLKSLYKQGRIRPAEFTQHQCCEKTTKISPIVGPDGTILCSVHGCGKRHWARGFCTKHYDNQRSGTACPICEKGRESLRLKGVSLADNWTKNSVAAADLRWLDSQLLPFLRNWRNQNLVSVVPRKIVRPADFVSPYQGVEAGLLKYAWIMIKNEVINDFKRMRRTDDTSYIQFNNGVSPDSENIGEVVWELDDNGDKHVIIKDLDALDAFNSKEAEVDIKAMLARANLTEEEHEAIMIMDLEQASVREYAEQIGASLSHANKIRNSALEKLRNANISYAVIDDMMEIACKKYGCAKKDLLGSSRVGPCVPARSEFFYGLYKLGLSIDEIVVKTGSSKDRVTLSINRAVI